MCLIHLFILKFHNLKAISHNTIRIMSEILTGGSQTVTKRLGSDWEAMHGFLGSSEWEAPELTKRCDEEARPGYDTKLAHEYNDISEVLSMKIALLARLIRKSRNCIAYTGAGLSRSAGISDYATKGTADSGWKKVSAWAAKPTVSHRVLVELYRQRMLKRWIQQNHDGLPQKAGLPQEAINEIHGAWYDPSNPVVKMDGKLRDDLFADLLEWEQKTDLTLALGTSLCGMNADRVFSTVAKKAKSGDSSSLGGVVVSLQETAVDSLCALRIFARLDDVMGLLANELGLEIPEETQYKPMITAGITDISDVFEIPYDKEGKLLSGDTITKMTLDLRVDARIKVTSGPHRSTRGKVIRKTVGGHYDLELIHVGMSTSTTVYKLGSWWVQAAVNGTMNEIPIVNVR